MALKGKTTIQLFDSKTGELLDTVEKSNIVTNAVSNILNGAWQALAYTSNNGKGSKTDIYKLFDFPSGYDLAKALFGGVLIFSKNIEVNEDHVIPSIEEIKSFIGCANQSAGIAGNTFKGSINESESTVGDNYVKFVWDFTSEQCNGDIACICLTSDCGGSLGYGFDSIASASNAHLISRLMENMWDSNISVGFNPMYIFNPMFATSYSTQNAHGMYINENYLYYVYANKAYKYDVSKLYDSNKVGIELFSKFNYGYVSSYDEVITLPIFAGYIFSCADDNCIYEFDGNQLDSANLTLIKISGNAVAEEIKIPTTNILTSLYEYHNNTSSLGQLIRYFSDSGVISNNKIYFLTGRVNNSNLEEYPNKLRMYVLSFDGSFTYNDIDCTPTVIKMLFGSSSVGGYVDSPLGVRFVKVFDTLFLQSYNGDNGFKYFMVDSDGIMSKYPIFATDQPLYGNCLNTDNPWIKAPWVTFKFAGNNFLEAIHLIQGYLATINNQDVVLTKTADKTMKIIYTLTQE